MSCLEIVHQGDIGMKKPKKKNPEKKKYKRRIHKSVCPTCEGRLKRRYDKRLKRNLDFCPECKKIVIPKII